MLLWPQSHPGRVMLLFVSFLLVVCLPGSGKGFWREHDGEGCQRQRVMGEICEERMEKVWSPCALPRKWTSVVPQGEHVFWQGGVWLLLWGV